MNKIRLLFFGMCFLLAGSSVFGASLLIQYDFLSNDITYYKVSASGEKQAISKPRVDRNQTVKIEVVNFNPFVYTAKATYNRVEFDEGPQMGFFNMINPLSLGGGGSSFLSQLVGIGDDPSRGSAGVLSMPEAREAYLAIEKTYETLYKTEQLINNIDFVLNKVYRLKYNPYLPGDSIKSFTNILLTSLFAQKSIQTQDFLVLGNTINQTVSGGYSAIALQVENFEKAYNKYASSRSTFEGEGLDKKVRAMGYEAQQFVKSFDATSLLNKLDNLEMMYLSVMNTPYQFSTNEVAKGDELQITLDFYLNPVSDGNGNAPAGYDISNMNKVKSTDFDITVTGDLKITSSLGLAFPYYSDNMNFINKDSIVTPITGNNYTPNITAYLNFYPYTGRGMMVGGTFGVGVPISDDTRNFNFLMGGALIFGSDNRMVVNFGASLGPVDRVGQGFATGDNLGDLTTPVPVTTGYQWGYFVGFSFTLADIKS